MSNKHVSNRNILITQEDDWFMAKDIETNVASQGDDINSALANLKETLELYYEDCVMEEIPTKVAFLTTMELAIQCQANIQFLRFACRHHSKSF